MKYLASRRKRLTGLGMGKDTKEMVSFLNGRGYNFRSLYMFIRNICRYLHDNGKVDKCPFASNLGFPGVNTTHCSCSSCYGWSKLLYDKKSRYIANILYGLYIESQAKKRGYDFIERDTMKEFLTGMEASLDKVITCIEEYVTAYSLDEDIIHDCRRDCMDRSYEISS